MSHRIYVNKLAASRLTVHRLEHPPKVLITRLGTQGPPGIKGDKGDQGIQGPAGTIDAVLLQAEAGEPISGHKAVVLDDGLLKHPDIDDPAHALLPFGVATESGDAGVQVKFVLLGEVPGGNFVPQASYFVGPAGQLITTFENGGVWAKRVGTAVSATTLVVQPGPTVLTGD